MSSLFLLNYSEDRFVRCPNIEAATRLASAECRTGGRLTLDIIPGGQGGPMLTLVFDRLCGEFVQE